MTQTEESGSTAPRQPDTLCILLPMGLWFALPDTWANRRGAMILLRGLRRRDGWPLVTYEHLAQALGYADRRNVHNFWAESEPGALLSEQNLRTAGHQVGFLGIQQVLRRQ